MHYEQNQFGFEWGAARVTRLFHDDAKGWVTMEVATDKANVQVYVSCTGKVTVYLRGQSSAKSGGGK